MKLLDRMVMYQKKNPQIYDPDQIFGKFDPRQLELNLFELFGPARSQKKANRY